MGVALEFKCIVKTNLIRVSYHCISCYFHFNTPFKMAVHKLLTRQSASVIKVDVVSVHV